MSDLIERVARDIADALGDNFDYAFAYRADYIDAALAAIAAIDLPGQREAAARAALEAAVVAYQAEVETWLQLTMRGSCSRQGVKAIRAIDPAAFRGDDDATSK